MMPQTAREQLLSLASELNHRGVIGAEILKSAAVEMKAMRGCIDDLQSMLANALKELAEANGWIDGGQERPKWFVCGFAGEENAHGLPQIIEVCPAFGASVITFYKRLDEVPD